MMRSNKSVRIFYSDGYSFHQNKDKLNYLFLFYALSEYCLPLSNSYIFENTDDLYLNLSKNPETLCQLK